LKRLPRERPVDTTSPCSALIHIPFTIGFYCPRFWRQLKARKVFFLYSAEWFESRAIKLAAGAKINRVDRACKVIVVADGREEQYDKLIIATGSLPLVPPIDNLNIAGFFVFRTIEDCQLIASYARRCRRAAVIGGGLLGLEAARGLLNHKLEVTVIEVMPYPMAQQLDPDSGALLARSLQAIVVRFLFEKATQSVYWDNCGARRRFQGRHCARH
jgi:nitrite reductase (NADH) large subunit